MALGSTLAVDRQRAARSLAPRGKYEGCGRRGRMTPRLEAVRDCLAAGLSDKQISQKLGLTVGTCKIYAIEVYRLTGMSRREIQSSGKMAQSHSAEGMPRMGAFE